MNQEPERSALFKPAEDIEDGTAKQSGEVKRFVLRVLKVWAASGLIALGASLVFGAANSADIEQACWLFGMGTFLLLSATPLLPWLVVDRWLYDTKYWSALHDFPPR